MFVRFTIIINYCHKSEKYNEKYSDVKRKRKKKMKNINETTTTTGDVAGNQQNVDHNHSLRE